MTLVSEHSPTYGSNGEVRQYLILDILEVECFTDDVIALAARALKKNLPQNLKQAPLIPAVAFIATSSQSLINTLARSDRVFPCYGDVQTAFDAMTPQGFKDVFALDAERKAAQDLFASKCHVENVEQRGFKAAILRLNSSTCSANDFSMYVWPKYETLALEHSPVYESSGEVRQFLMFDVLHKSTISETAYSLATKTLREHQPLNWKHGPLIPSVAFIATSRQRELNTLCKMDRVFPCYANLQAAFDAMTPKGFRDVLELRSQPDSSPVYEARWLEQRGFTAVVLRFKNFDIFGDATGMVSADAGQKQQVLIEAYAPRLRINEVVTHFLLFDMTDASSLSDGIMGFLLTAIEWRGKPVGRGWKRKPAVALTHCNASHLKVLEKSVFNTWLPAYADEEAALDDMTPTGFRKVIGSRR